MNILKHLAHMNEYVFGDQDYQIEGKAALLQCYLGASLCTSYSSSDTAPCQWPGESTRRQHKCLDPCYLHARLGRSSWLLSGLVLAIAAIWAVNQSMKGMFLFFLSLLSLQP